LVQINDQGCPRTRNKEVVDQLRPVPQKKEKAGVSIRRRKGKLTETLEMGFNQRRRNLGDSNTKLIDGIYLLVSKGKIGK